MHHFYTTCRRALLALAVVTGLGTLPAFGQNPWNGKVVLQGYWWDYWNSNYPNAWANYLTDLSPRLRNLGFDMVWIPPTPKNGGTNSVGYGVFDAYDLGDKYQKGSVTTRFGTKDQYLRFVAVAHANGLGVVQDVVLNHVSDAGSASGAGGYDPESSYSTRTAGGYKNFRYVSYATPATDESESNYWNRRGRWPKNFSNFHPNQWVNTTSGDIEGTFFGPDFCYQDARAYGGSTNATYNPAQYSDYNRTEARNWVVWMKKQTGVDGFRWDAVKNFPAFVVQDMSWNLKYGAGWANGGSEMFNVGEYVGSASELDSYVNTVQYSNGGSEDLLGTFDFSLRQEIKNMTSGSGGYNLGNIVSSQQSRRLRTVPFVNNHDTFRPQVDANGNYTGWNSGSELGGGHIDPFDARLAVGYALIFAVDGSPQVFFEDLFNVGGTGKRYSHLPTNTTDLPARDEIVNIIWCHQKLNFKQGSYKVRWQASDLLIIERSNRAIIGMNDNWDTWQNATVQTDFAPGTRLKDYSGANSGEITVDGNSRATIWVPPCNGSNVRRGYCIWGPVGVTGGFSPATRSTTQEWEMADDLGDSHASSLQQGGALPAGSNAVRTAGRIYAEAGTSITLELYPTDNTRNLALLLANANGSTTLSTQTGTGNLTLTYTVTTTGYHTVQVRNNNTANPSQRVYVKATYTAPREVNTLTAREGAPEDEGKTAADYLRENGRAHGLYARAVPNPAVGAARVEYYLPVGSFVRLTLTNLSGRRIATLAEGEQNAGEYEAALPARLPKGLYVYTLTTAYGTYSGKVVVP